MNDSKLGNFGFADATTTTTAEITHAPGGAPEPSDGSCDLESMELIQHGKEQLGTCAGEWTRCRARLSNYPFHMTVRNAQNSQHGYKLATKCRSDVIDATYYSNALLICAPYIACNAL